MKNPTLQTLAEARQIHRMLEKEYLLPALLREVTAKLHAGWSKWLELKAEHENRLRKASA